MADGDARIRVGTASRVATPTFHPRVAVAGLAATVGMGAAALLAGSGAAPAGRSATVSMGTVAIVVTDTIVYPVGQSVTVSRGTTTFPGLGADLHVRVGATSIITAPGFTAGATASPTGQAATASQGTAIASVINGANPVGQQMVATASGAGCDLDATVGVDGMALTASIGTVSAAGVTGNNAVFPTGQSVTASQGTVVVFASYTATPTGTALTASQGASVPIASAAPAPAGQSVTASQGTVLIEIGSSQTDASVPVTGQELATAQGTAAPLNSHDPSGFGLTVSRGTTLVVVDDTHAASGEGMTVGQGIATARADVALTPSGFGLTATQGTVSTSGNRTVTPTGFRLVTSQGTVALGGPDLSRPLLVEDKTHPAYDLRDLSGSRYEVTPMAHPRYWILEVTMATTIYLNNDDEFEFYVTRRNTSTGEVEPAAGLAGMTCRLSATKTGSAIHANLSVSASERAGAPGYYYGVMQGSDFTTHLASYVGRSVFRQLVNGSDIVAYTRVTVRADRPIV